MTSRLATSGTRVMTDNQYLQPPTAGMTDTSFRLNLHQLTKPSVGPGSYTIGASDSQVLETAPRAKFGLAHRFLPSKVGYISPRHNSDLLCTASPGPKYHIVPTPATYPRQPALSWGEKLTQEERDKKAQLRDASVNQATDVGPAGQLHTPEEDIFDQIKYELVIIDSLSFAAFDPCSSCVAYTPKVANIKPSAPRCAFDRSNRFGGPFGSYQTLNNSTTGATMYAPNADATLPSSPRYTFGATRNGEKEVIRQKPRTSFMTHSIRGGLAKPATLECNVGPGDYDPRTGDIGTNNHSIRTGFGSSPRFMKAGLQYISSEHAKANVGQAGPGPKYLVTLNTTNSSKTPRTSGLKWIP